MTTLSKEDVSRMAEESGMTQYIASNNKFLEHFATLARADLVAENEKLELRIRLAEKNVVRNQETTISVMQELSEARAENERLKEQIAQLRDAAKPIVSDAMEEVPVHPCDHNNEFVKVAGLSSEMQALYVALRDTAMPPNAELQDENKELRDQLTATRTALAAAEAREMKLREALIVAWQESPHWKITAVINQPRDDSALREMIAGVYEECVEIVATGLHGENVSVALRKLRALAEKAKEEK